MSTYHPDVWVVLEFSGTKVTETYRRILAGWYGGFAGSNSWKLSSGVNEIIDKGDHWEIPNHSGSVYICYKNCERFSGMTGSIFANLAEKNCEEITVKQVKIGDGEGPDCWDWHSKDYAAAIRARNNNV